ncbi:MAG: hypothetical protein Homavirus9_10 [Homavirus sp.]|uniref:Uncharacterized protein n=1 Tax=Homavirus sp. TaxID=2487769 RepID=A0A3G5A4J1_9VIRU|nr:MAG: hypothetical protein Homavirus9_10 [Homavirus sp.]
MKLSINNISDCSSDESITNESITDESITDESITDESITDESVTDEFVTDKSDESITDEAIIDETITDDKSNKSIESITDQNIPKYNNDESFAKYVKRVEKYKLNLLKTKYQLIIDFINDWLKYENKYKIKSLTEFKNMLRSDLLSDNLHNQKIICKYNKQIGALFNMNFKNPDIMYLVTRMLSMINYKFQFKDTKTDTYCSIIQK